MIIAKNDLAHNNLSRQFMDHGKNGDLERIYDALVWGIPKMSSGKIETKITFGIDPFHESWSNRT